MSYMEQTETLLPTSTTASSAAAVKPSAMESSATVKPATTEAGPSAGRKAPHLPAVPEAAESA